MMHIFSGYNALQHIYPIIPSPSMRDFFSPIGKSNKLITSVINDVYKKPSSMLLQTSWLIRIWDEQIITSTPNQTR